MRFRISLLGFLLEVMNTKTNSTAALRSGKGILVADRGANTHTFTMLLVLKLMLAITKGLTHDVLSLSSGKSKGLSEESPSLDTLIVGARRGTRTLTPKAEDFKSSVTTNSTIRAI